ncbi:formate dehydrogenase subunit delta [Arhodomonas sp. AD133]|uniref:formate dehydrogenase subunit delta n=1 Tax=Arhodomonas sp. AD133 TaxID=3415009 RepID=UPI003EBEBD77
MQIDKLVRMANEIATYFEAYPQERGQQAVLEHIRAFWEPRMRMALAEHAREDGGGLRPLARWAADRL